MSPYCHCVWSPFSPHFSSAFKSCTCHVHKIPSATMSGPISCLASIGLPSLHTYPTGRTPLPVHTQHHMSLLVGQRRAHIQVYWRPLTPFFHLVPQTCDVIICYCCGGAKQLRSWYFGGSVIWPRLLVTATMRVRAA